MRIALGQFNELTHERLTFAKQLGVSGVQLNTPLLPGEQGYWELRDLKRLRERCDEYGLKLEALENVPRTFYHKAMLGLPGRDEQIENYQKTVRNMAAAGIPVLGYNWMPNGVWRTPKAVGRGGVLVTAYDHDLIGEVPLEAGIETLPELAGREIGREEMWENYRYFTSAVIPVVEEVGLKLAIHPDDPPLPTLGGVARIFDSADGFRRALEEIAPSPNHGMEFCLGCFSEMGGDAVADLRYFAERGTVVYLHLRDVQGSGLKFQECFLGEGNFDTVTALCTLKEVGFDGFIIDDHVPHFIDDSDWNHRGHAHTTGYILGMVEAVDKLYRP
ncbi:MAG: mannonate dehydratase [Trueperaceae bacterium]|nr:MAG: mannonate dehydratase [Trueperaceae bacterium]